MLQTTRLLTLGAVALCAAALPYHAAAAEAPTPMHALFIGNSYTAFNDMPRMVAALGGSLGHAIVPTARTAGGKSLAYHLQSAETLAAIASRPWDAVVLQDYSLAPGLPPDIVAERNLPNVRALIARIRASSPNARIIYYETWGRRNGNTAHCRTQREVCTFDGHALALARGYALYRDATGGELAHVGAAWRHVVHDDPTRRPFNARALWVADGSHPSMLGSYLAAATILRTLTNAPIAEATATAGLPAAHAAYLRSVVDMH